MPMVAASSSPGAPPGRLGEIGLPGRAETHGTRQLHDARLDPGDPAVLLVGRDTQLGDQSAPGLTKVVGGGPERRGGAPALGPRWPRRDGVLDIAHQDHAAEPVGACTRSVDRGLVRSDSPTEGMRTWPTSSVSDIASARSRRRSPAHRAGPLDRKRRLKAMSGRCGSPGRGSDAGAVHPSGRRRHSTKSRKARGSR